MWSLTFLPHDHIDDVINIPVYFHELLVASQQFSSNFRGLLT